MEKREEPRIIFFDLETLPNMDKVMKILPSIGMWPGRTLKAELNSIICFGYKISGMDKADCVNSWDFEGDINDDSAVVAVAYEILKDADVIVTHNGKRFDLPVLNTRLMAHGYPPLHKIKHVDTKVVAKRISLYSNRLGDVSSFLGGESKLENGGWDLWCKVLKGDKASMDLMTKYCKQDVEVLEQVYTGLRPLLKSSETPEYNMHRPDDLHVCPNCGSDKLIKNGRRRVKKGEQQRYLCNGCGSIHYSNMFGSNQLKIEGV